MHSLMEVAAKLMDALAFQDELMAHYWPSQLAAAVLHATVLLCTKSFQDNVPKIRLQGFGSGARREANRTSGVSACPGENTATCVLRPGVQVLPAGEPPVPCGRWGCEQSVRAELEQQRVWKGWHGQVLSLSASLEMGRPALSQESNSTRESSLIQTLFLKRS